MARSINYGRGIVIIIVVTLLVFGGLYVAIRRVKQRVSPRMSVASIVYPPLRTLKKTNSWFSSAYSFPSEPLFALPGAYKITANGIEVSFPTPRANEKLLAAGFVSECQLNRGVPITSSRVVGYGDWNIRIELTDSYGAWFADIVMGAPDLYLHGVGSTLSATCPKLSQEESAQSLFVWQDLHGYIIEGKQGTREGTLVHSPTGEYRLSLIHRDSLSQAFIMDRMIDWAPIVDTKAEWTVDQRTQSITTTYTMTTPPNTQASYVRFPHMGSDRVDAGAVIPTVLGSATVHTGTDFTLTTALPNLPLTFSAVDDVSAREAIIAAIRDDANTMLTEKNIPAGVYFKGTWIGALTTLTQLADTYALTDLSRDLTQRLEQVMSESLPLFVYDQGTSMVIAKNAEFGNEKGNDHHFHYGYYIRAAAVLTQKNPSLKTQFSPVISQLVADIASTDRASEQYPFLRMYSPYEGHSWADGQGKFADGNNQESTSEALNAWYAIKLWGDAIGDKKVADTGSWLFSQELAGTKSYWFAENNPFPPEYTKPMASLVWGGKREYATWFSANPMHVVGIQLLPITPASTYLQTISTLPTILEQTARDVKNPYAHEWGDLFAAAQSLATGKRSIDPARIQSSAGLKLRSLLLQELYSASP